MTDPYKILEISPDATDEEVKEAYRKMAKKYHPDNYAGSPLADLANEKMKEVNEAYDQILNERKATRKGSGAGQSAGGGYRYGYGGAANSSFADVRNLINSGRIDDAEQILNGVQESDRNAEWYFLKGTIFYRRGWFDQAYQHLNKAVQMDPSNMEYRMALNQMNNQRNGTYGGYNPNMQRQGGCTGCDVCSSLLCADCCCECMGGDLIRCC